MKGLTLWSLAFALSCIQSVKCIPLARFYPFGNTTTEDFSLDRTLDGFSVPINLTVTFPFFDQNYDVVFVNNNGMVSFESGVSSFFATPFPLNDTQGLIAVYWTDVDTRPEGSGTVWYRETADATLLRRFREEIQRAFPTQRIFNPISLFIATWDHVGYYNRKYDKTNTFQCVMGTDGTRSFVAYLYADGEIQWAVSEDDLSLPAQVGFNAGDGIRFFAVPESRSPGIINIDTTSNVDVPGVWVFRVDQEGIMNAGCTDDTNVALTVLPRLGTVLGGTPIRLLGPCFEEADNITCQFNDVAVEGKYINEDLALCVSPEIDRVGQVMLHLTIVRSTGTTGYTGQATFHFVTFDDANEVNIVDSAPVLQCAVPLSLEWLPEFFFPVNVENSTSAIVNIDLYHYNTRAEPSKWQKMINLATNVPNTGSATVEIPKSVLVQDPQLVVIKISLSLTNQPVNIIDQGIAGWSDLAYSESMDGTLTKLCLAWTTKQSDDVGDMLLERLPPCPPNVRLAVLDSLYLEERQISSYREFFHPNASRCFHQATLTMDNQGSGQQCCYFADGTLIVGVPNGGSVDMIAPRSNSLDSIINHQFDDVLPYIYCCKSRFSTCDMYYKKRPSDNGRDYVVFPPACVYGDPHIVTLDGYKYTFNGKGEFTLIETLDDRFTLQARMIEATGAEGDTVEATVFSALVGKQNDSDTVQLELSRRGVDARVNGMRVDFEDVVQQSFNNVTLFDVGNRTIEAIFSSGVLISAKEENGIISVLLVSLSNSYMGSTRGLMGIFNGDTSDDLIPKESSEPIPLNSSLETIHNSFGITWIINNSADSLFDYHEPGESWSTYYDPDFTPLFGAEFSDPEEEAEAMELCQGDEFCLYDFATTGSMDISLSTLNGSVDYEEMVETAKPIICNPSCVNGACIANDTCQCAMGYVGQICTEPVYIECDVNPCENNGTCQSLAGSYICNCSRGFSGLFCEQNVTFSFEKDHYTVNEEGGRVELCILQSGESIIDLSIIAAPQEFTAEGGVDYESAPVSVQFNQTDDRRCFHITIIDDFNRETAETFEVALLANAGVTIVDPSLATVTIIDDDTNRTYDFVEETLYTVPLHIDEELVETHPELSRATLCYSIDGRTNRYFNLVSDKCVSVNAYYVSAQRANFFNVVSKIGVTAVDSDGNIQNIEIDQENCSATVGTTPVTSEAIYHSANITVRRRRNGYRIAVPNCEPRHLVIWVTCESTRDADLLKFVIARGVNLMPTSHGLVGQFWNVPVDISPYEGPTPDDSSYYLVMITPPNGKPRHFVGDLYPQAWDLSPVPCIYAGNSQGGTLGEFGDANDPVIEGHYSEYVVADLFATQFKYSQFNN